MSAILEALGTRLYAMEHTQLAASHCNISQPDADIRCIKTSASSR